MRTRNPLIAFLPFVVASLLMALSLVIAAIGFMGIVSMLSHVHLGHFSVYIGP